MCTSNTRGLCDKMGFVGIALAVRAVGQPTAAGYARRPPARAFGAGLSPSAQLAHVCVCELYMAVESRWWSGITRYANGRSAGSRDPLAIRSPRLSRHKKKGSSALIPSSLGYQLCGYRHCLSQERNTAGAVGTIDTWLLVPSPWVSESFFRCFWAPHAEKHPKTR